MAIIFLIAGRGFRRRRGRVLRRMIAINIYALAAGVIGAAAVWNYGYLCRKPFEPSRLDLLGPWP